MCLFNVMFVHTWMKAHYEKSRLLSHCSFYLRVSCLNSNHVINVKKIHNVFACYDRSKLNRVKCQKNYIYLFYMINDVKIYLHNKSVCHNVLKNYKYIFKKIEIIFCFYEICNIYWTLRIHMFRINLWTMWKIW
jgi:hypothetical protein